jgi:hypothetical protein
VALDHRPPVPRRFIGITWVWRVIAGVAVVTAALFAALSYFAMPERDRPKLEPATYYAWRVSRTEGQPEWHVQIGWLNQGKGSAEHSFVTVYAADEKGTRQNKLGSHPVGSDAREIAVLVSTDGPLTLSNLPDHLLICTFYQDERKKKYWQALRYRVLPPAQLLPPSPYALEKRATAAGAPTRVERPLEEELPRPSEKASNSKKLCR